MLQVIIIKFFIIFRYVLILLIFFLLYVNGLCQFFYVIGFIYEYLDFVLDGYKYVIFIDSINVVFDIVFFNDLGNDDIVDFIVIFEDDFVYVIDGVKIIGFVDGGDDDFVMNIVVVVVDIGIENGVVVIVVMVDLIVFGFKFFFVSNIFFYSGVNVVFFGVVVDISEGSVFKVIGGGVV